MQITWPHMIKFFISFGHLLGNFLYWFPCLSNKHQGDTDNIHFTFQKKKSSSKNKSTSKTKFWLVLKIQINWPIFSQVKASKYMFQLALSELNYETWSFPCSINLIMEPMLGASHFINFGCFHTEDTLYIWKNLGQHL